MGASSASTRVVRFAKDHSGLILLGALMATSALWLFYYRVNLNFTTDDWSFVIGRESGTISDFLDPHNEHISIIPVAIYKVFLQVFGMGSPMPLHVFSVMVFLLAVLALFYYLKSLAGEIPALFGCAIILFLGSAFEHLLWIFQLGFSISLGSGLMALIMLRREDRKGDRLACLFLCICMLSNSIGIAFVVGTAVNLLLRAGGLRKLFPLVWIVAIPTAIYVIWWIGWGHTATATGVTFDNFVYSPEWVFEAFRLSLGVLTGTFNAGGAAGAEFMRLVAAIVIGIIAITFYRRRKLPGPFLVALSIALTFWCLAAINGRAFDANRYLVPGAMFVLMMLAGALDGYRFRARDSWILAGIALVAIAPNIHAMSEGYQNSFKPASDKGIASLTALDIARRGNGPAASVGMNVEGTLRYESQFYFAASDKYGSPAWNEVEIDEASPQARSWIDETLLNILPISMTSGKAADSSRSCNKVRAADGGGESLIVPGDKFTVRPRQDVLVLFKRFADSNAGSLPVARGGRTTVVRIPADNSARPWRVSFDGRGVVALCPDDS
jgi:hypothetical protein